MIARPQETLVVVGNGMVGQRFLEKVTEFDTSRRYRLVTFCEEPRAAYDRVGLTSFFAHRDAQKLMLARIEWYRENFVELHLGDRATEIDRDRRVVRSAKGEEIPYDALVLATGSVPFVPPMPGVNQRGVFVYRTIDDLERIIDYGRESRACAVIGGGLLGLEAAKAALDLGLETHVLEFAPRLMPRQIDDEGSAILVRRIQDLGVRVHLSKQTKEILGPQQVTGVAFGDGTQLDVQMVIVSAGIRPRDELARKCGLAVHDRGGVAIDDRLRTSDADIYAIGECASHRGMVYGLVAPGYEMAETLAANLTGGDRGFYGADLSTKLKLMGVDVASFGRHDAPPEVAQPIRFCDPFGGVYKKLLVDPVEKKLVGGILVGDASDYGTLVALCKAGEPLAGSPGELLVGKRDGAASGELPDHCQVCSCNNVTKGQLREAIRGGATTIGALKSCTKAGTGCGGCVPLVTNLLNAELKAAGKTVNKSLCEHFAHTRQELFEIAKIKQIKSFDELLRTHGRGNGCEVCKPAVASILASLWNDNILDHATLQDTNDRFLANMQRGGLYSVVPRVPGGEIRPEQLIVLGEVARKYGLYSKITGGQRVDLFGARVDQLPDVWEELIAAGFESGHAYGKAMRTVKSCVGSTWCRYGVQDSVGFAIRVEQRYRGLRAPHKLKAAVSGCIRECAEAQCKDFGLIATEKGYNLYVCGNGGAKPRHADLLAADLDEATALRYIDRFLMYYIQTADKLTRTSVWLENLEGGIDYLRAVIVDDKLGIADELERQMQYLVDTYRCEWTEVVNDPERRRQFRQFVNSDDTETGIEIVTERSQNRPADWPKEVVPLTDLRQRTLAGPVAVRREPPGAGTPHADSPHAESPDGSRRAATHRWVRVGRVDDFPRDGGATIKYGAVQIAVFRFASRGEWYACQNMCPHKNAFVLSRGLLGDSAGVPKVACPLHKKTYSLQDGSCLTGDKLQLQTFPVRIDGDAVLLHLPPEADLDALLATELHQIGACSAAHECSEHAATTSPADAITLAVVP